MATLLSICQDVSDEIGFKQPGIIMGGTSEDARRLKRLANRAGTFLMKAFPWQVLTLTQSFTAASGSVQSGALPSDFDRFIPETFWDQTNDVLYSGPIPPARYANLQAVGDSYSNRLFYRSGGSIYMLPAMAGGESMAFEYVSKNWCQSSGGTGQSEWAADTDTPVLDAELFRLCMVMLYLRARNLPSDGAAIAFQDHFNQLTDHDRPDGGVIPAGDIFRGGNVHGNRHWGGTPSTGSSGGLF